MCFLRFFPFCKDGFILLRLLFYPSRRLGISSRFSVYIISPCGAVSHHASACISLRLDEIPQQAADDTQCFALMICNGKPLICFRKYGIMCLKEVAYMGKLFVDLCRTACNGYRIALSKHKSTIQHSFPNSQKFQ